MDKEIVFSERQRFKQWWLWFILLGVNGLFLFGVFIQVIEKQQFGDKPMSDAGLLIVTALFILFTILFLNFRLETQIKKDGIYVRFFPFHLKFRKYEWREISKCHVRQYRPISEYGGWGLRGFGKNKAINISGNKGLQLEFVDKRKILVGTNNPKELEDALIKIGQIKELQ